MNPIDDPRQGFFGGSYQTRKGNNDYGVGGTLRPKPAPIPGVPAPTPTEAPNQTGGNPYDPALYPGQGGVNPAPLGGGSGGGNEPSGAQTLGQPMYPWLMPWQGPFAAPLTGTEQGGLNNLDQLGGSNFGLNNAQNYISDVQGGKYLDVASNPYIGAIGQNLDTQRGLQDQRMMQELQSRAAAGGNALSGALMQQEGDYQRGSNANYNQIMNQMYQNMYSQERGYQNQAPGQQEDLLRSQLGGIGAQMGYGAVPRDIANQEIQGQYHDFTRQGQALQDQSRYSDYLNLAQQGRGYPQQTQNQFGDSNATQLAQLFAQMFGQGGSGTGGWTDLINGILGGGGDGGSTGNNTGDTSAATATDGRPLGYDGASDYSKWLGQIGTAPGAPDYGAALTQRETDFKKQQSQQGKASGASKAMTIMAMISALLGSGRGGSNKQKSGVGMGGGGNSLGGTAGKGINDLLKGLFGGGGEQIGGKNDPFGPVPAGNAPPDTSGAVPLGSPDNPYGPYANDPLFDTSNYGNGDPYQDYNSGSGLFDQNNFAGGGGDLGGGGNDFGGGNDPFAGNDFSGGGSQDEGVQF